MQTLRNLKIGTRLALAFSVVLALLIAVAGVGVLRVSDMQARLDDIVNDNNVKIELASQMRARIDERAVAIRNVVLLAEVERMKPEVEKIKAAGAAYAAAAAKLAAMPSGSAAQQLQRDASQAQAEAAPLLERVIALALENKDAEATTLLLDKVLPAQNKAMAALAALEAAEFDDSRASSREATDAAAHAKMILAGATLAALLCGATFAFLATRSITRPIGRAVVVAQTVAAGDLTADIRVESRDETGELMSALQLMNNNLVALVAEVRQSSDSIATGSSQIAVGSSDLSQRTEEQASNLQQTAASMEQLTATTRQNSTTAREANRLAATASEAATQGGDAVGRVVTTMESMSATSRRISDIIGVIDGIAFQTNILALNAAVEAARAGEQGRGFAVVAGEVRALAQRSATAAREIKTLINESVEGVAEGALLVQDAGRSMDEIVSQVRRVGTLIGEISSASDEQSQGIGQIGHAVNELDQVTQQNAALVEESAAAAESLNQQANKLAAAVGRFKLAA